MTLAEEERVEDAVALRKKSSISDAARFFAADQESVVPSSDGVS